MVGIRIGQGVDVHAFGEGHQITVGGVTIPHSHGLVAHSDGDVLIHALIDALLGALALGDIGRHFPDTDPQYQDANSRQLLKRVRAMLDERGYSVVNADMTLIAQAPKMAPYIYQMSHNIAADLSVNTSCIGIKATTSEMLGFTGRKEGIMAMATVLVAQGDGGVS